MHRDKPTAIAADDDSADIIVAAIREVLALDIGLTTEQACNIERRLKERYGDQRVRVKKKLHFSDARANGVALSETLRAQVYQDGLTSMSNAEITSKHGISRATLYRWMKSSPGSGSGT